MGLLIQQAQLGAQLGDLGLEGPMPKPQLPQLRRGLGLLCLSGQLLDPPLPVAASGGSGPAGGTGGTTGAGGTGGFTGTIGSGTGTLSALFTLAGKSKQNPLKQHNAVLVTVQCKTVPCVVTAGGTLSVPKLAKVYRFKTVTKTLTTTGKTTIKLLIPKKALKSLKKVIAKKKSAIAKIKVTAKAGGKSSTAQRTIVLKR